MTQQATDINSLNKGAAGSGVAGSGAAGSGAAGPGAADKPRVVFDVQGLTRVYQTGGVAVHALRGVDLKLYDGEFVVLLGASGSGKSTLLNILGGLDTATAGQVLYTPAASRKLQQAPQAESSYDLTHATEKQLTDYRRHHVGFVFQFYNLIPSLTARENITVVTEIALQPMQPEEALALVNLTERQDHFHRLAAYAARGGAGAGESDRASGSFSCTAIWWRATTSCHCSGRRKKSRCAAV